MASSPYTRPRPGARTCSQGNCDATVVISSWRRIQPPIQSGRTAQARVDPTSDRTTPLSALRQERDTLKDHGQHHTARTHKGHIAPDFSSHRSTTVLHSRFITPVDVARGLCETTSQRPDRTAPLVRSGRGCLLGAHLRADQAEDHRGRLARRRRSRSDRRGADGSTYVVTGDEELEVDPGDYIVSAESVSAAGSTYYTAFDFEALTVEADQTTSFEVDYRLRSRITRASSKRPSQMTHPGSWAASWFSHWRSFPLTLTRASTSSPPELTRTRESWSNDRDHQLGC